MKTLRLLPLLALLTFSSCDDMNPFGDAISKKDLYGQWTPVEYERDGITTEPSVEQRNDYIKFNPDKTFECVEKEVTVDGSWNVVPMFNVLNLMTTEDPNNCIPLTIETLNENELVYRMTMEDGTEMKTRFAR